jgi:tripeptidyl-peptidase-1
MYTAMPSYQTAAVTAYLKSGVALPPTTAGWNSNNRAYPDVAGIGENVCLLDPGTDCSTGMVGGTSASAPMWGGIITLLNSDRLTAGKAPLGFVNPVIYAMFAKSSSTYFYNTFTSTVTNSGECTGLGFTSMPGQWTPITGCGSPNFANIRH